MRKPARCRGVRKELCKILQNGGSLLWRNCASMTGHTGCRRCASGWRCCSCCPARWHGRCAGAASPIRRAPRCLLLAACCCPYCCARPCWPWATTRNSGAGATTAISTPTSSTITTWARSTRMKSATPICTTRRWWPTSRRAASTPIRRRAFGIWTRAGTAAWMGCSKKPAPSRRSSARNAGRSG